MKLGIKIGPQHQSFLDLEETNAPFTEVWFNIEREVEYDALFSECKKRNVEMGLHFWGKTKDGIWANIAHTDTHVTLESMQMIQHTIDVAANNHCVYVNIHPGGRSLVTIDFDHEAFRLLSDPIPYETAETIFFENLTTLNDYAKNRNVVLTLETIPSKDANGWRSEEARKHTVDLYLLQNSTVVKAATRGFTIANDFGHTAASISSDNRTDVSDVLWSMTNQMIANTKLLHIGFIIPPYNGTDFHNHFDHPKFETLDAVPNRDETKALLQMFLGRDVWALAEPDGQHKKNYFYLKKLLEEI